MKKYLAFISGIALYVAIALVVSAYGNATMHLYINEAIFDAFYKNYFNDPSFANYTFSNSTKLTGTGVTQRGQYSHSEGDMKFTIGEWVRHGGYSADEPELLQALRHFYDPKGLDGGKRYLTDIPPGLSLANPYIHILEWALEYNGEVTKGTSGSGVTHYLDQHNSWEDGKQAFYRALNETDKTKQEREMAHAWRALGESLHALGDMACPVHVRNDGHPTGDSDPYENAIVETALIPSSPSQYWDNSLLSSLKATDSIRQLFHMLALYTNENFFTNQTVYGKGVDFINPSLRPGNPYPLPYAQESGGGWDYDPIDFTFYKNFGANRIKMCKDRYYFASALQTNYRTRDAYVDLDVARSQSQVLLSTLVGIGPEVIKRFLPQIQVSIDNADFTYGEISGSVDIAKTAEYPNTIRYNSWVQVTNKRTNKSVEVVATDGYFYTDQLQFAEGDEIEAFLPLHGMYVKSDPYTVEDNFYKAYVTMGNDLFISGGFKKVTFSDGTVSGLGFGTGTNENGNYDKVTYDLSGQTLTILKSVDRSQNDYRYSRSEEHVITFNASFTRIEEFYMKHQYLSEDNFNRNGDEIELRIKNIDKEYTYGTAGEPMSFYRFWIKDSNGFRENLLEFKYRQDWFDKIQQIGGSREALSIDWSNPDPYEPNNCWVWIYRI